MARSSLLTLNRILYGEMPAQSGRGHCKIGSMAPIESPKGGFESKIIERYTIRAALG